MRRLALCIALWMSGLPAQVYVSGPQVLTFLSDFDDTDQPYALYLPKNFDPARKYPLVVSLHGAWSNHRLNLRRVFGRGNRLGESDSEATRYFPALKDVDFIVASPLARGTMGYQGIAGKDVYDMMADVERRFPIDSDRVYLTGLSMGGGGTLWLGLTRPDVWAAIAAVCPAPPPGTDDLAPNALNLAVHLFQGDLDPLVKPEISRQWYKTLLNLGTHVEYIEYPGVRHNAWDYAYRNGAIFDWFAKFRRNRYPDEVRFVTRAYKYTRAYWVDLDGLTPGALASIDARFTGPNQLDIKTAGLDGFTLNLEGHPKFSSARPLRLTVDDTPHRLPPRPAVSFLLKAGKWAPGKFTPPPGAKRAGLEGPIAAAFASRHIYVYGTADSPSEEELNRRREVAARAADWSSPRLRLLVANRVAADKEITLSDLKSANLVLFGTKETNTLMARFADRLPLALNAGAADYGLLFVAPIDGRYVVVNSGLPWWTGAERSKRPGLAFLRGAPYALLASFGDYALFKGSLDDVIAEGRFDRNWKLPPPQAEKLKASGAVEVGRAIARARPSGLAIGRPARVGFR